MANTKSAIKRVNVSSKKKLLNTSKRSALRKLIRTALASIENNSPDKNDVILKTIKAIDQASTDGIIHKNKAARDKSKLAKQLN
ncbi:MAG TPA: 30S ribosomal protein S20 [Clostridia bacterium]|jgi:small subunit ribosomal protein S20|nr:MAG: 30S ribosomal protein S20 [Firmicutes bacterium ADurb.Bin146]HOD92695.1 30S ribosomal protein S20 [Clostridia bacterium]